MFMDATLAVQHSHFQHTRYTINRHTCMRCVPSYLHTLPGEAAAKFEADGAQTRGLLCVQIIMEARFVGKVFFCQRPAGGGSEGYRRGRGGGRRGEEGPRTGLLSMAKNGWGGGGEAMGERRTAAEGGALGGMEGTMCTSKMAYLCAFILLNWRS